MVWTANDNDPVSSADWGAEVGRFLWRLRQAPESEALSRIRSLALLATWLTTADLVELSASLARKSILGG